MVVSTCFQRGERDCLRRPGTDETHDARLVPARRYQSLEVQDMKDQLTLGCSWRS
jgi:hypothetical protein